MTTASASPFSLRRVLLAALAGGALAASARGADLPAFTPDANAPRSAVPALYQWDLMPLFTSDEAFAAGLQKFQSELPALGRFAGRLGEPAALADCLDLYFRLHRDANFLTLYANLRLATAQTDDTAGQLSQRSLAAMGEVMRTSTFIRQEVLALPAPAFAAALAKEPRLAPHRAYLENIRRRAARVLPADGERVLGMMGDNLWAEIDLNELPSAHEETFRALLSDLPLPRIKDAQGRDVQLTLSNYSRYRASPDREVRRAAVAALFGTLRQYQHAFAGTLAGQVGLDINYARARHYDTAVEAYLDKENVDPAVYENLVRTINAHTPLLHRYVELRRRVLKLPDVHIYDLYIPLVAGVEKDVPFADALRIIPEALKPLGADYGRRLAAGLDPRSGWVDLYPHRDKQSGAFASAVYGPHPWVLMNYQNSLDDMSTLAHEFGHALHYQLAAESQTYPDFRYPTILAEIASTCNETLLSDYLIAHAATPAERTYLLVERLESIRTTIFRQAMFAEFERTVHTLREQGTPLTAATINGAYRDILRRYYGPAFTIDPDDEMEWAYIPHFYYKYYVYTYATGLSSGIAISELVKARGEPAAQAYLDMLRGGCAKPPLELLKHAGVDLKSPAPIEAAMKLFGQTLDAVEKELAGSK